jgi:RNA polymerase sigma-70 factor (ECF subfamily)
MSEDNQEFLDATLPHLDALSCLARRLAEDPHRAEDLVQETYLRAFAAFAQKRDGSVRSWLVAICLNTSRSEGRRLRCRPREDLEAEADIVDVRSRTDVPAEALAAFQRQAVGDALARLPDPQRLSIVLVDLVGLSAQEAADVLGCPRGTVLARVHRGRRRLAQLLDREGMPREA